MQTARKHLKKPGKFWKKFFGQIKPRLGKEKYGDKRGSAKNMVEAVSWRGLPVQQGLSVY